MIKRKQVSSSAIASLSYNTESKQLEITFADGGVYKYFGVPEYVYHEFAGAESFGKFYNDSFKKEDYAFIKVK